MTIENLVNILGPLAKAFKELDPNTIQHACEITNEMQTNKDLRNIWLWTADSALYTVEKVTESEDSGTLKTQGVLREPVLDFGPRDTNLIFRNIDEATQQLIGSRNYVPKQEDIESVVNSGSVLKIKLLDLELKENDSEFSYFEIDTKNYNELNKVQRAFAERVYGQGEDFGLNMKMLNDAGIESTRIYVLNPKYVCDNIGKDGAIVRACVLNLFGVDSWFDAGGRNVGLAYYSLRGVRLKEVAEGDAPKSNPIVEAYHTILGDADKAIDLMTPEIAAGISRVLTNYLSSQQKQ